VKPTKCQPIFRSVVLGLTRLTNSSLPHPLGLHLCLVSHSLLQCRIEQIGFHELNHRSNTAQVLSLISQYGGINTVDSRDTLFQTELQNFVLFYLDGNVAPSIWTIKSAAGGAQAAAGIVTKF